MVLRADDAPRDSRDWQYLMALVKRTLPAVQDELRKTDGPVLLTYPGLLACYEQLGLLDWLRDQTGRAGGIPGLWVLVSCDDQQGPPMVDGKPVPVITRAQWARIPEPWLQNVHRGRNGEHDHDG